VVQFDTSQAYGSAALY